MKRFVIFAAVAPPLGFIIAFWVMLQIANWLAGSPNTFDVTQMMMLPTIYLIGLIPALAAAWFDHVLAKRHVSHRIARTALFFAASAPFITGQVLAVDGGRSVAW
jgi:NAD(P)-dependent dehydrogenase (short-subunit alcohol dehydrogenase family)